MQLQGGAAANQPLQWLELGEVPTTVRDWLESRMTKFRSVGSIVGGFLFGGLAGFASNAIVSSSGSSFVWNVPLFFAVGIPVGIGEFFFTRWFVPRIAKALQLKVRRVAISTDKLHLELESGKLVEWTLKHVRVSKVSPAGGWHIVSLPAGRTSLSFWAPPVIANSIQTAVPK